MKINDLKKAWAQLDEKISDNFDEEDNFIKKMNLGKSKLEMKKVLNYEYLSLVFIVFVILSSVSMLVMFIDSLKYSIPCMILIGISMLYLMLSVIKIKKLLKIDYYRSTILTLQESILIFQKTSLYFRKIELVLLPLYMLSFLPPLFKIVHNIDIYQHLTLLLFEGVIILGLAYPFAIWIYKHVYEKKIKKVESLLNELNEFKKEN